MKFNLFNRQKSGDKFKQTLEKYRKASEENPNDLRIRVKIAELYVENNMRADATREYLDAARAYQQKRLFQIAVAIFNHAISISPDDISIYTELANLHLRNGFVGDGVAALERLAHRYYEKNMLYEAAQVLKKIREIDPNNEFYKIKVENFYKNKDISEEETLRAGPSDKWHLVERDAPDAVPEPGGFDLAAALDDDDITINISTISPEDEAEPVDRAGAALQPDEVFNQLKELMLSEPDQNSPQFHYNLAMAYQRCSYFSEALDEYRAAFDGVDDKVDCCLRMSECAMSLGSFDAAQDAVASGLKLAGISEQEKLSLIYQSGLIYKVRGDQKKAMKVFRKIYEADKNYKSISRHMKELSSQ